MTSQKRIVLIFLFFAFLFQTSMFGNDISEIYEIKWNKSILKERFEQEYFDYYGFEGAIVNHEMLPIFRKIQRLPYEIMNIQIVNAVYDTLPTKFVSFIPAKKLTESFEVSFFNSKTSGKNITQIDIIPLKLDESKEYILRLLSFQIKTIEGKYNLLKSAKEVQYPTNSVLSSGKWYKFKVSETGVYRFTYSDILNMGFDIPQNISLYGLEGGMLPELNDGTVDTDLKQIPIKFYNGSDGIFNEGDYIIFYLKGPTKWAYNDAKKIFTHKKHQYSYYSYYFLTDSKQPKLINSISGSTATITNSINTFNDYKFHELDTANVKYSGREWYGEKFVFAGLSNTFDFSFPHLRTSDSVYFESEFISRSAGITEFAVYANNKKVNSYSVNKVDLDGSLFANSKYVGESFYVDDDDVAIRLEYSPNGSSSEGYLDYIRLNAVRDLNMSGNQMAFRNISSIGEGNVSKFTVSEAPTDLAVIEVTDFYNAQEIKGNRSGNSYEFVVTTDSLREFVAFIPDKIRKPIIDGDDIGQIENQNLHGSIPPDYLIITHGNFSKYAEDLAQFHREHSGLDVLVVDQENVFNEFSSGSRDIAAIRNCAKMFYDKSNQAKPRYMLLFGDGSFDNKHFDKYNYNYILTYQSENSLGSSYVSDDYYGLLDPMENIGSGSLDVGIGRFPVSDTNQAKIMVSKVKKYMSDNTFGDWRNTICFIGDDEDNWPNDANHHMEDAEKLVKIVKDNFPKYNINKIYLDAYKQVSTAVGARYPDVNKAIYNQIEKGALLFNYTGHGAEFGLAHERILSTEDVKDWKNWGKFPVFITATCEFSRYDYVKFDTEKGRYVDYVTTGEYLVLHDKGGAVASFTTTREVYADPNFQLNKYFYNHIFEFNNSYNERNRLGDVIKLSKIDLGGDSNKRKFTLLGDPALVLAYPEHKVVVDSINSIEIAAFENCSEISAQYNLALSKYEKAVSNCEYLDSLCSASDTLCENMETVCGSINSLLSIVDSLFPYLTNNCEKIDTLGALGFVIISGHIEKSEGGFFNDFNGELFMTVFDKIEKITTLDNDKKRENDPFTFELQNNIIFKGKASVEDGYFRCSFIVPKDIAFMSGHGKISCYANNFVTDASGCDSSILIGGFDFENSFDDNEGPEIDMYLGNDYFKEEGLTNESPTLLAYLFDESGINTTTSGLGHEMMAVIDDNFVSPIIMNDFYEAELDNYKKGTIRFPLLNLEEGEHTVWIKVWDILNNSSEKDLTFVVKESDRLVLKNVYNYPNPASSFTNFMIEHNLAGEYLKVTIKIYSMSGQLVTILYNEGEFDGYMTPVINWDIKGPNGDNIRNGMYFYRVLVESSKGLFEKSSKILIVR